MEQDKKNAKDGHQGKPVSEEKSTRPPLLFILILVLFMVLVLEVASYLTANILQDKWAMYEPDGPINATVTYDEYLEVRDPVLGWPRPYEYGGELYTEEGAIRVPANLELEGEALVTLYGDSFTKAHTPYVRREEAWPNLLALELGRPVDNFGVGGYGSDQALVRFLDHGDQHTTPIVIMGHMAENMVRNLTRIRELTVYGKGLAFKPRFDFDESGDLIRVPIPTLTKEEYLRVMGTIDPPLAMEYENFGPMGRAGAVIPEFPYSLSLIRNFGFWRFKARMAGLPMDYWVLYEPDHPFRGLDITEAILETFSNEATRRGQLPLVLLFPSESDALHLRETGVDLFGELEDRLRNSGVEVLNLNPLVAQYSLVHEGGPLYQAHHFGPELSAQTAGWVYEKLDTLGWIQAPREVQ